MQSGKAPIVESSTVAALRIRQSSHRRPLSAGIVSMLTVACWTLWVYLVLPLVSLLLWALGLRLFISKIAAGAYEGLRSSLLAYSTVLAVLVGLLALWILWNVRRYGGRRDRRTIKRPGLTNSDVQQAFDLDDGRLAVLRGERRLRLDLDGDGGVMVLVAGPSRAQTAIPVPERPAGPHRIKPLDPDGTRSG